MSDNVTNNTEKSRFELVESGETAYADYALKDEVLSIKYVYSPESLRGTGAAGRLMEGIAVHAKDHNLRIIPICGYAVSWLRRHPEHGALLA